MLVTFSCRAYADITFFGDVAIHLLKLMGHSGRVPGALTAQDVQPALERLETALAADLPTPKPEANADDEDDEPVVSLSHRALPLIELLKAAAKEQCHVMWAGNN